LLIFPTLILFCIASNKLRSFLCKVLEKTGLTLHLVFNLALVVIFILKHPSASVKPERNQGIYSIFVEQIKEVFEKDLILNCLEGILTGEFLSIPVRVHLNCINFYFTQ